MTPDTIHLVFKTHLDIGFTDHAEAVRRLYHDSFIPQALDTAEHFHAQNPESPAFVWTTGAWLIHDHLATGTPAEVARLETAIRAGLIRWHALPFTTHTELMSPALLRAALSYSQALDARFGMVTRAAKMTDVPGHTLGLVPVLAAAGVRFLHLGVNTASPVPDVPPLFRWRAPGGAEIVVMYQDSYGGLDLPEGMRDAIAFAHTEDNIGPQTVAQTDAVRADLTARFPGARLRAATLEDYGALLWERRAALPVLTQEIGDSWIHGVASDPLKLARFRALQRLYDAFEAEGLDEARSEFGRRLCLLPEHTWGVDIKTHLRDDRAWDRPVFEAARRDDPRFAFTEASWVEQRAYLDTALAALDGADRTRADAALADLAAPAHLSGAGPETVGGWRIEHDATTGDIAALTAPDGRRLAGRAGPLFGFRHQSFDAGDMARHLDSYLTDRPEWAILDHEKPGLDRARTARSEVAVPRVEGLAGDGDALEIRATLPDAAHAERGAPARLRWHVAAEGEALALTLVLEDKPANRMPEAGIVDVDPAGATGWELLKTGLWLPAGDEAPRGGGALQAVFALRAGGAMPVTLTPRDTALAGPAAADLMQFDRRPLSWKAGVRLTLYTNKWGTNFPMWWEGDLVARFRVELG